MVPAVLKKLEKALPGATREGYLACASHDPVLTARRRDLSLEVRLASQWTERHWHLGAQTQEAPACRLHGLMLKSKDAASEAIYTHHFGERDVPALCFRLEIRDADLHASGRLSSF